MNRSRILKATLCMTTAITTIVATNIGPLTSSVVKADNINNVSIVDTQTTTSNNSLAGISLSLDNYYVASANEQEVADQQTPEAAPQEAAQAAPADQTAPAEQTAPADQAAPAEQTAPAEQATPAPKKSKYEKTAISVAKNYVNIRKEANETGEILGKLYQGAAAKIIDANDQWVKVKSGSVTGYVSKEYVATGEAAEKVADKYGKKYATTTEKTTRIREKMNTDCTTLTLVPEGEKLDVVETNEEWAKVQLDDDITGFVSLSCVDVDVKFDKAISIEEEQEALRKQEEAEKAAAEEAQKQAEAEKAAQAQKQQQAQASAQSSKNQTSTRRSASSSSSSSSSSNSTSTRASSSSSSSSSSKSDDTADASSSSSNRSGVSGSSVASYALQFVGRPYRRGGNSLTNGIDCSGFSKAVYAHFGITLPARTAAGQAATAGKRVSLDSLQPGDLVFYTRNGRVNHVAIYIGGGRVVHASNPTNGIMVSNYTYRTPYMARRVLN